MDAMALKAFELKLLADYLNQFSGQRVGKFIQYGKDVFSFRLQREGNVVMLLDNQNPLLFLSQEEDHKTSLATPASAIMRKKLSGAEFLKAETLNDDRVIELSFLAANDIFELEPISIVLELIPTKANMALLDKSRRVLFAFRSNTILDARPLFHGVTYEPPIKKSDFAFEKGDFDIEAYFEKCHASQAKLQQARKNNLYQDFFRELNAKIKSLKRKAAQIDEDIEKGKKHADDYLYGNYIFTYIDQFELGQKEFDYYGEKVALDPLKSPSDNANEFFRRTKKSKNAIAQGAINKEKALEELEELTRLKDFAQSCDEETLSRLLKEHGAKGQPKAKSKAATPKVKGPLPYVAQVKGTTLYYGKSAKQNDYLSFLYATKGSYLWFHVKNATGAHVILPYENPSDAQIQIACELALAATDKVDGEVQYTAHKNIRKGGTKGQVILGSYQSAYIKSISEDVLLAYEASLSKGKENG